MKKIYEDDKDNQRILKWILEGEIESGTSTTTYGTYPVKDKGFWYCWRTTTDKGQGFIPYKNKKRK